MSKRKGFTLIELLVVISIIALLMAILMPALARVRAIAREVVCRSNFKQHGLAIEMYASNNNGYLNVGWIPGGLGGFSHQWVMDFLPYYGDIKLLTCPSAKKYKGGAGGFYGETFGAWSYISIGSTPTPPLTPENGYGLGSYGINEFVSNTPTPLVVGFGTADEWWRTANVRGADNVPVILDSLWAGGFPRSGTQTPPDYRDEDPSLTALNFIRLHCIDRHSGHIDALFLDSSARRVGLKELWTFEWFRGDDTKNEWTIAGYSGTSPRADCAAGWDSQRNWMKDFKEF